MPETNIAELPFQGTDLSGIKLNRLTVLRLHSFVRRPGRKNQRFAVWECKCDCGKIVTKNATDIKHAVSCGCYQIENNIKRSTRHGYATRKGLHRLYEAWRSMWQRCTNKNGPGWKNYGGRGIKVCDRWKEFVLFRSDMEPTWKQGLSLDRINVDLGYSPDNCRWATWTQQMNNRRPLFRAHFL